MVKLRGGQASDIETIVELLEAPQSHGILSFVTGGKKESLTDLMQSFSSRRRTVFSFNNTVIAQQRENIFGMFYGFDRDVISLISFNTFWALLRTLGFFKFLFLLPLLAVLFWKTRIKNSDYYVSNIAVRPIARRMGIGYFLMKRMEDLARMTGKTRIVLDVAADNDLGRKFFESLGFTDDRRWSFRKKRFSRMVKCLYREEFLLEQKPAS
jgi:ribosomal protein S18 acetylase RimI-like enzyme